MKKKTFLQRRTAKVIEMKGVVKLVKVDEMYNVLKSIVINVSSKQV